MELSHDDALRVQTLLRHTAEFMAYFELVENNMMNWQEKMAQHAEQLQQHILRQNQELSKINQLLSAQGMSDFRNMAEKALTQGKAQMMTMERVSSQFLHNAQQQQEHLFVLREQCLEQISHHTTRSSELIAQHVAKYDAHQFHRIANESCDHVARVAQDTIAKSSKLLGIFQLRSGFFAVCLTIITAFVITLYLSDELPWEMHHQAMNERQAGKVLLQAWPKLTQEEKSKILNVS